MSRYISDYNKVVYLPESGVYAGSMHTGLLPGATAATSWVGQVQELSIDEAENKKETRYLGQLSRDFQAFDDGPIDITGTLNYNPQDMNLFFHALGSVYENPDGTSTNILIVSGTDSNSWQKPFTSGTGGYSTLPFSFTLEDSKQTPGTNMNLKRIVRGCVIDNATLTLSQGEKATIEVNFIANTINYDEGTTSVIGSNTYNRSYLWSDSTLTLGGVGANAGSSVNTAREIVFEVAQNVTPPHYVNGSRTIAEPFMGNRNYTLTVTADMDSSLRAFYDDFYKGGSIFHGELDLTVDPTVLGAAGSQHTEFYFSGCEVVAMEMPSPVEGVNETTITIRPQIVEGKAWQDERTIGSANPF